MKKNITILALIIISTAAQAQTCLFDDMRGSYRVVTNVTAATIGAVSNGGVTINGVALGNGTNITVTASGNVATNDSAYLAATTGSVYYAGTTTFTSNRVTYIGTNAFAGGSSQTNVAHNSLLGIEGAGTLHVTVSDTNKINTAWQNPASSTNWTWTSDGAAITLTGYSGPSDVVIPDTLDNLPVTKFNDTTVFVTQTYTSISGGNNIRVLQTSAFNDIDAIKSVSLLNVTNVGDAAFISIPNLTAVYFGQNAPPEGTDVYTDTPNVTNYVLSSTATGWGATWNGRPVVRLPIYADEYWRHGTNLTDLLAQKLNTNATPGSIGAVSLTGDITRTGTLGGSNAVLSTDYMTLDQGLSFLGGRSVWYMRGGFDPTVTWSRATATDIPTTNWTVTIANATDGTYGPSWVITNLSGTVIKEGVISLSGMGASFNTGGGRSASYKWEAYITNTITGGAMPEWSDQGIVKVLTGTADYLPMTIAILVPTNLPVGSCLVLRPKVTAAANTPTITITGGSNSLSSVSLPTGIEANLGTRGATSITVGSANSYSTETRELTVAAVSNTPAGISGAGGMTNGQTAADSLKLGGLNAANYYQSQQANEKVNTNDLRVVLALTNAAAFDAAGAAANSTNILWIATTNAITIATNDCYIVMTNALTGATNTLWIATTNAIALSTNPIPAQITAAIDSPYQAYTSVGTVANGTCTVTYASGSLVRLTATGSPTVLTFDNTNFPTSGVSRVAVELWAGTNSITFPTARITNSTAPTISTTDWTSLIFRRSANKSVWTGGQVK